MAAHVLLQGYRAIRAGLIADTYLEMESFELMKQKYEDMELSEDITAHIDDMSDDKDIYSKLARSICPEIYGHEDVKKALLLQLVGGVTRHGSDGMRIRGDINVLLMGDPGVAKSQLLKHIATIAPRGVYTTVTFRCGASKLRLRCVCCAGQRLVRCWFDSCSHA